MKKAEKEYWTNLLKAYQAIYEPGTADHEHVQYQLEKRLSERG